MRERRAATTRPARTTTIDFAAIGSATGIRTVVSGGFVSTVVVVTARGASLVSFARARRRRGLILIGATPGQGAFRGPLASRRSSRSTLASHLTGLRASGGRPLGEGAGSRAIVTARTGAGRPVSPAPVKRVTTSTSFLPFERRFIRAPVAPGQLSAVAPCGVWQAFT